MEQLKLPWHKRSFSATYPVTFFCIAILVGISFWGGILSKSAIPFAAAAAVYDTRAPEHVDLGPLFAAWNILDQNFAPASTTAPTTTPEEKLYGAISGLARSYGDDYTVFFPPKEKEQFETTIRGDFEGVGMEIGLRAGILTVVSPIKGTPAFNAGLLPGDKILKINDESTDGIQVEAAVSKIRGPKGTVVTLYVSRDTKDNGKPFEVKVTRDRIVLPTIETSTQQGVFIIKLYSFNQNAASLFAKAVADFAASGSNKLVIDLRNNPGGYLESAVDISSWFLPQGDIVVSEDYGTKKPADFYRSYGYSALSNKDYTAVVLINQGSASASEIVTGALVDHKRAIAIGERSFGKGSVQQIFDITDKTSLKVTVARWLTPNGTSISQHGIEPSIKVEKPENEPAGEDAQLARAIQYLVTGK